MHNITFHEETRTVSREHSDGSIELSSLPEDEFPEPEDEFPEPEDEFPKAPSYINLLCDTTTPPDQPCPRCGGYDPTTPGNPACDSCIDAIQELEITTSALHLCRSCGVNDEVRGLNGQCSTCAYDVPF